MEKQTLNVIKKIYKFNQEAGLLEQGYSDERESAFPIEEMLEGFDDLEYLSSILEMKSVSPKDISRCIIDFATNDVGTSNIADVDRLDKHLDAIVFCFGSIFKLGLTPQEAIKALGIVMDANMQKLKNKKIDSVGKVCKDENFIGPETALQAILDERKDK
jgi:predicted HAD superfamily Cof-like phosphohydrolase